MRRSETHGPEKKRLPPGGRGDHRRAHHPHPDGLFLDAFRPNGHELAHQRGISSEQECNFLAILACTTCGRDDYAYSGWLLGYIYLGNALHGADTDRWQKIYDALPETAKADLSDNNAYWAQFRSGTTRKVSNKVYDSFLKSYGESKGLQSYGTVVDLLVAYYQK